MSSGDGFDCSRITICLTAIKCEWSISIPIVPVSSSFLRGLIPSCFPSGLLLYQSLVVFLDHWYPCFRNFDSVILVDVIRVKPSVDNFLDSCSSKQSIRHDQHLKWLHSETSNETVYYTYLPPGWAITSFTVLILKLFLMLASMKHVALCRLTNYSLFFSWTVRMQVTADVYFTFVFLYVLLYSGFLFNIR